MRPPREAYWRATLSLPGSELIAGIEMQPGDDLPSLHATAKELLACAGRAGGSELDVAEAVERGIMTLWSGRAYFIEVAFDGEDGCDGYVQIFQPLRVWREPED